MRRRSLTRASSPLTVTTLDGMGIECTSPGALSVSPLGDYVLVKPVGDAVLNSRFVIVPDVALAESMELRQGLVIACGPGDKAYIFQCVACGTEHVRTGIPGDWQERVDMIRAPQQCEICTGTDFRYLRSERHPMYVKPGDHVIFGRAGDVRLDGEDYHLVHEEQHIWAVLT